MNEEKIFTTIIFGVLALLALVVAFSAHEKTKKLECVKELGASVPTLEAKEACGL